MRLIVENRDGEWISFSDLEDLIRHCRDDALTPETVIVHSNAKTYDWTDGFLVELRETAPELFDYDDEYDFKRAM